MDKFNEIAQEVAFKQDELRRFENIAGFRWRLEDFLEFLDGTEEQHAELDRAEINSIWTGYVALVASGTFKASMPEDCPGHQGVPSG